MDTNDPVPLAAPDDQGPFADAEVISAYTRAQAITDGTLVDVTDNAREAGFKVPVALTRAVWQGYVEWPDDERAIQDESGRLWDVLYMAHIAGRRSRDASRIDYELYVVPRAGLEPRRTVLSVHIGPGDAGEPVVTIMEPSED